MRLKEITPGMVIHCKNDEEKKALLEEAERLGYLWYGGKQKPTEVMIEDIRDTIHFYDAGQSCFAKDYKHITHSEQNCGNVIDFSDLIIPELTAEEVLNILNEIRHCRGRNCDDCPFSEKYNRAALCKPDFGVIMSDTEKLLSICQQWKSEHEKKEPEIETVDICRIIEIQPNGKKRCVHEEDIKSVILYDGDERQETEEILKRYCMEHDGEFIAVHEVVSRVKK